MDSIETRELIFRARIKGVFIGDKDSLVTTPVEKVQITWSGFKGDKHAGRTRLADVREDNNFFPRGCEIINLRQFSAVSEEELQKIADGLDIAKVKAEWLGANLLFEGMPFFSALPPDTHLFFDRYAVLVVAGENEPCRNPGEIIQLQYPHIDGLAGFFAKQALGKRGVVGFVKRPGIIRRDSTVVVKIPKQILYMPKAEFEYLETKHNEAVVKSKRHMPTAEEADELLKKFAGEF